MENKQTNRGILEKHTVNLDDKLKSSVTFYSYYNSNTPIYYELSPIINLLKFTKEMEIIANIPINWKVHISELNDDIFAAHSINKNAIFVEASGIAFLIALSENKSLANTVTTLYNTCIRKTESARVTRINTKIDELKTSLIDLRSKLESLQDDHINFKTHHEKHVSKHTHILSMIRDAMHAALGNHNNLITIFESLLQTFTH